MKKDIQHFVIDRNRGKEHESIDMRFDDLLMANNYLTGLKLGYLRASAVIVESIEGLTDEQKIAIYKLMDEATLKTKIISVEREEKKDVTI